MNFNVIDIIILVLFALSIISGVKRGFIMSVFNLVGIIISFFIAKEFYYVIETFLINNTKMETSIYEFVYKKISPIITSGDGGTPLNQVFKGFERLPFDFQKNFSELISSSEGSDITGASAALADNITALIITFISFILALLLVFLILFIVAIVLNTIVKMPVLNLANKILGGALGIVITGVVLYLVFALATPFIMISDKNNIVTDRILESKSSEIFYQNNIILDYLSYKEVIE